MRSDDYLIAAAINDLLKYGQSIGVLGSLANEVIREASSDLGMKAVVIPYLAPSGRRLRDDAGNRLVIIRRTGTQALMFDRPPPKITRKRRRR